MTKKSSKKNSNKVFIHLTARIKPEIEFPCLLLWKEGKHYFVGTVNLKDKVLEKRYNKFILLREAIEAFSESYDSIDFFHIEASPDELSRRMLRYLSSISSKLPDIEIQSESVSLVEQMIQGSETPVSYSVDLSYLYPQNIL